MATWAERVRTASNYDLLEWAATAGCDPAVREELARRVREAGNDPWWV
jgi:hypothetical protein